MLCSFVRFPTDFYLYWSLKEILSTKRPKELAQEGLRAGLSSFHEMKQTWSEPMKAGQLYK